MGKNKYLLKNTVIFAIGNIATRLLSFLLVPLYTNVLTTEEFGIIDLLCTICSFIIPIFSFNIIEAVLRFSLDKNSKNNKIMSIGLISIIFMIISKQQEVNGVISMDHYPAGISRKSTYTYNYKQEA